MIKAWDTKDLIDRLKSKGLEAAEKVLKVVASEVIDWASESLMLSTGVVGKVAAPIIAGMKPVLLAEIDKIDGVSGN